MCRGCWERFSRYRLQRKPLVSDPAMHHGMCATHVPWCMTGSLTRGGVENVPGIPGACTNRNITYLVRGPCFILTQQADRDSSLLDVVDKRVLQFTRCCITFVNLIYHDPLFRILDSWKLNYLYNKISNCRSCTENRTRRVCPHLTKIPGCFIPTWYDQPNSVIPRKLANISMHGY